MFIAMNRFQIHEGREKEFELAWKDRDTYLEEVPGFREFHLLRGATADAITSYVSHSVWDSEDAFAAWTKSEAFRKSHAGAGSTRDGSPPFFFGTPDTRT